MKRFGFILFAVLIAASTSPAKRKAPPGLIGVGLGANVLQTSTEECGVLCLRDRKTNKLIRTIRLYRVEYLPDLEKDVQDVWVKELFLLGKAAWARDEKDRIYRVTLEDLKAERVEDMTREEFEKMRDLSAQR